MENKQDQENGESSNSAKQRVQQNIKNLVARSIFAIWVEPSCVELTWVVPRQAARQTESWQLWDN